MTPFLDTLMGLSFSVQRFKAPECVPTKLNPGISDSAFAQAFSLLRKLTPTRAETVWSGESWNLTNAPPWGLGLAGKGDWYV